MTSRIISAAIVLSALAVLVLPGPAHAAAHSKQAVYGAIAYEPNRRAVGYAYDFKSSRDAKIEALRQCGDPACEVVLGFHNACGAVARGSGKPIAVTGATRAEAETKAMRQCGQKACEIVAWACTK